MFNILIVEDDKELSQLFQKVLEKNGYQVKCASDGMQALETLDTAYIDLIISDIMMPVMDGYELVSRLRAAGYQIPVLIVGIILYYLIKEIAEGKISKCLAVDIFGLAAMATSIGFVVLHLNKRYMTSSLIAGLLFGLLFLLCSGIDNKFFAGRVFKPFIFVGKHSYGIYCFHQIVINCIMRYAFNKENLLQWGMAYLAIATISCLVGYATEKAEKQLVA